MIPRTVKFQDVTASSWWSTLKALLIATIPLWSSKAVGLGAVKSTGLTTFLTLSAVVHVGLYSWLAVPVQTTTAVEAQPITLVSFSPAPDVAAPTVSQPVPTPSVQPLPEPPVVVPPKAVVPPKPKVVKTEVPVIKTKVEKKPEPHPVEPEVAPAAQEVVTSPEVVSPAPVVAAVVTNEAQQVQGPSMIAASSEAAAPHPGVARRGERAASELERYVLMVQQQVQAHLHYPLKARKWHIEGKGKFQFEIAADGSLTDNKVTVLASCGRRMLDRAAIRTIRDAAPFAAPPHGALTVTAPIIFELR